VVLGSQYEDFSTLPKNDMESGLGQLWNLLEWKPRYGQQNPFLGCIHSPRFFLNFVLDLRPFNPVPVCLYMLFLYGIHYPNVTIMIKIKRDQFSATEDER
jgi:hypothetical protein